MLCFGGMFFSSPCNGLGMLGEKNQPTRDYLYKTLNRPGHMV